jgi:hypothetical protein
MLPVCVKKGRGVMKPSEFFAECQKDGTKFAKKAVEFARMLDGLEEREWLALQDNRDPPRWGAIQKAAIEQKLGSLMEESLNE